MAEKVGQSSWLRRPVTRASFISVIFLDFLYGFEYSLIMPTVRPALSLGPERADAPPGPPPSTPRPPPTCEQAWKYVQRLGGGESYLGLVLACFPLFQVAFMPILTYLVRRIAIRPVLLLGATLPILGNLLYSSAEVLSSRYAILFGRALAGIG